MNSGLILQHSVTKWHKFRVRDPNESFYRSIVYPGSEIPEWFTYKSEGSSITIPLHIQSNNCTLLGVALCLVLSFPPDYADFGIWCGKGWDKFLDLFPLEHYRSEHTILIYDSNFFVNESVGDIYALFEFYTNNISVEVKRCGMLPLYRCDEKCNSSRLHLKMKMRMIPVGCTDIVDPSLLKTLHLRDPWATSKVRRLIYANSGKSLLALASNGVHKLWTWQPCEGNPSGKATTNIEPHQLWQAPIGTLRNNDASDNKPAEEFDSFIASSQNDSSVISGFGGKVSLFNNMFQFLPATFMSPATSVALCPWDNAIIAIGMEDSSVLIYSFRTEEVITKLVGHQQRITGLAFSHRLNLNVLVSSGADAQLCMWSTARWEKMESRFLPAPPGHQSQMMKGETIVQFNIDALLVVHETQIAIYDSKLECRYSWYPKDTFTAPISSATFSSGGLYVYTAFCDGAIGVFAAYGLRVICRISPSAYIPSFVPGNEAYPSATAAHPFDHRQFALGMSNGAVHVIEAWDETEECRDEEIDGKGSGIRSWLYLSVPTVKLIN